MVTPIPTLKYENCDVFSFTLVLSLVKFCNWFYWQSQVFKILGKIHTQKKDIQTWHADK